MTSAQDSEDLREYRPRLYAFGSNGAGQLGTGHKEDVSFPVEVLGLTSEAKVTDMACGGNHTLILQSNGRVAASGNNNEGQCLMESHLGAIKFAELEPAQHGQTFTADAQHVAATWTSSLAITTKGASIIGGSGGSGELGLGRATLAARRPIALKDFPPPGTQVVKVSSCMGHTVVVLTNGEAWGWGKGRQGQLGAPAEHRWQPGKIEGIPFFVVDAACGKDFTCVLGHPSTGELLMLGPNGKDRFGLKANAPASLPYWKQAAASWGSMFVLLGSGRLLGWGRDDHGQLPPRNLPCLKSIAAGSEHCLGLTAHDGNVLAWGWGEHGNCGPHTDADGDVKGRWSEIRVPYAASAVFAGCATSFVVT